MEIDVYKRQGYKILKGLLGQIKDRNNADYQKYFNELMNTHDFRIDVYKRQPLGTGPEIINGVRASSINTESVSYTHLDVYKRQMR